MHPALTNWLKGKIDLSPEHQEIVSDCFIEKSSGRNELLVRKGAVARHLFFVVSGCVRVFLTKEDGSESTRFLLFEGRIGTAFPSFILQEPSAASVQSIEPSELLLLSYENSRKLLKEIPGWETMTRIGLERDYIESIRRIEGFITLDAKDRYRHLLETNPEIVRRLPARIVADYLGISQETLSRLKGKK